MFRIIIILTLLILSLNGNLFSEIIYVSKKGNDIHNGKSWALSLLSIDKALEIAQDGDEIWIAEGEYKPSKYFDDESQNIFFFIRNNINIYGGFEGVERSQIQRNIQKYRTIISSQDSLQEGKSQKSALLFINGIDSTISLIIDGLYFIDGSTELDSAYFQGGGISATNADLIIRNCTFENNRAVQGGAINLKSGNVTIGNSKFYNNYSTEMGGSISISDSDVIISDSYFSGNESISGACIFLDSSSTLQMENSQFENNTAANGGVVCTFENVSLLLRGCLFSSNKADYGGVYYSFHEGDLDISDCQFIDNEAQDGGAIFNVKGLNLNIEGSIFESNKAYNGGAAFLNDSKLSITNSEFLYNNSDSLGSAINAINCKTDISRCNFYGNKSKMNGALSFDSCETKVSYSKFRDNSALWGNDLYDSNGSLILSSSLFIKTHSYINGLLYTLNTDSKLINCTFSSDVRTLGSLIKFGKETRNEVINSIIFSMTDQWDVIIFPKETTKFINSCLPEVIDSPNLENCILDHPIFNLNSSEQYSLMLNSPCLDAGNNDYVEDAYDVRYKSPRKLNKLTGLPGVVDIGAYEYFVETDSTLHRNKKIVYVNKSAKGLNNGTSWHNAYKDINDVIDSLYFQSDLLVHYRPDIFVAEGVYSAVKMVKEGSQLVPKYMKLINGTTIYGGFPSIGNPDFSHRNPEKYKTILDGEGNKCVLYVIHNDSTAILDGFTITGANNPTNVGYRSGVFAQVTQGIFRNCNIINNFAGDGAGAYIFKSKLKFINCNFTNNNSRNLGGAIFSQESDNEFENCNISGNSAKEGGGFYFEKGNNKINNCNISNNTAESFGGLFIEENNIVISNTNISNNHAKEFASSNYMYRTNAEYFNCKIEGNGGYNLKVDLDSIHIYTKRGGGFFISHSNLKLTNCLISNHIVSESGSGIFNGNSFLKLTNVTIANNYSHLGGCIYQHDKEAEIINSIIWNNFSGNDISEGIDVSLKSGSMKFFNSCVSNDPNNVMGDIVFDNCIHTDPLFKNWLSEPMTLSKNSPCIDMGIDSVNTEQYDIRGIGYPRKADKNTGGSGRIDIGAFEYRIGIDDSIPKDKISLISPNNMEIIQIQKPEFIWEYKNYFTKYQIQISRNSNFADFIVEDLILSDTLFSITNELEDSEYFWRVRATNGNNEHTSWSEIRSFLIDTEVSVSDDLSDNQSLITISNGGSIVSLNINLKQEEILDINILNLLGKSIDYNRSLADDSVVVISENLTTGLYFLRITTKKGVYIHKFIINK